MRTTPLKVLMISLLFFTKLHLRAQIPRLHSQTPEAYNEFVISRLKGMSKTFDLNTFGRYMTLKQKMQIIDGNNQHQFSPIVLIERFRRKNINIEILWIITEWKPNQKHTLAPVIFFNGQYKGLGIDQLEQDPYTRNKHTYIPGYRYLTSQQVNSYLALRDE